MQGGGGNRMPCRFGMNCRKLQSNTCTFYHPPNELPIGGQGGRGGQGGQGGNPQGVYVDRTGGMGGGMGGGQTGGRGGRGDNSFIHHTSKYPQQQNPNTQQIQGQKPQQGGFKDKGNEVSYVLCRNFHQNEQCKFGQTCRKKHSFMFNDQNGLRQVLFTRNIPSSPISKLTTFKSGAKDYFVLRNANNINFFQYNIETQQFTDVYTWNLPDLPNGLKYNYYDHKGDYIYYSYPNPQTFIEDMAIFQISTQKIITVSNSHQGRITGMAHFNENVLLTTTLAGQFKIWQKQGQTYVSNIDFSNKMQMQFNINKSNIQLLFLDISEVNGTKIISSGTNDGRLLFFLGNDLNFHQIIFKQQAYSKVYAIRYANIPGNPTIPCAIVLLWDKLPTISTLMQINLNNFNQQVLVQNQTSQDNNRGNICFFEMIDTYLLVGNIGGQVSMYRFPDTSQKVGGIMHQNTVNEAVYSQQQLKSTGIKLKYMLMLEKRTPQREGSLGLYIIK